MLYYNAALNNRLTWETSEQIDLGLSAMLVNQGEVRNRGFEATIGWSDKVGEWSYFINANYSYNKNWVSDIGVTDANGNKGIWTYSTSSFRAIPDFYRTEEDMPVQSYYLTECLGIFQNWDEVYNYTKDGELIQPNAQRSPLKTENTGATACRIRLQP